MTVTQAGATPDVSFIMAAHNVEAYVDAALDSALAQAGCTVEVVVVDDGSADATHALVAARAAADPRIRLIRHEQARGPAAARNTAVEAACGAWLAVLDADDTVLPGRSAALMAHAAVTGADIVADNLERFEDASGSVLDTLLPRGATPYSLNIDAPGYVLANRLFAGGPNLGYLKPMMRRAFVQDNALRYDETLRIGEDYHLILDALIVGARYVVTDEPFYRYRVRGSSISHRLRGADIDALLAMEMRRDQRGDYRRDPALAAAAALHSRALRQARTVTTVVDHLKQRQWRAAFRHALARPAAWRLMSRTAVGIAGARLRRLAPAGVMP